MVAMEISKPNVLIVEDEPSIADNIRFALQLEGFTYHWVGLGIEAVELLQQQPDAFDIVILDIGLPDTSGLEICKLVRRFSAIPIIFLSARGSEIDRVVGLEIGADDYLTKPFSPRELVARIKLRVKSTPATFSENHAPYLSIDIDKQRVTFFNKPVDLTLYEFGIIATMAAAVVYVCCALSRLKVGHSPA